ncbi:hypothetical protein [Pseudomonas boanensis]|uniref:hypothetical protein n=1 Tax=Metapseudomonas boanensis TaxID=2822138 RepID=UPI0035D491E5
MNQESVIRTTQLKSLVGVKSHEAVFTVASCQAVLAASESEINPTVPRVALRPSIPLPTVLFEPDRLAAIIGLAPITRHTGIDLEFGWSTGRRSRFGRLYRFQAE